MSAPKAENGFTGRRIVSSRPGRRNNSDKKDNDFNDRRATGGEEFDSLVLRNQFRFAAYGLSGPRPLTAYSSLLADRRKQISAASDGADHGGLGRVGLDLAADWQDSQVDGAITLNARRPDLHVKQHVRLRDLAAPCARVLQNSFALKRRGRSAIPRGTQATLKRGRREDRVRAAPAVSCAKGIQENAHEHTGSAETLRPSLRNGFTAYFVLSPVRPELVCHRRQRDTKYHRRLDTCHRGVRTTRLCRPLHAPFVKSASASIAPRPNVSNDGQRPSFGTGWRRISR
jgi:hypothetical protein